MRAILSAPGSRGDVNPMIAIGKQLRDRGYEVVISMAETYAHLASDAGLQVEPIISREEFSEAIGKASVWKPIRGPLQVFRVVVRDFLERHFEVIRKYHQPGQTVLVAHPLDVASRIMRDADAMTPMFSVHLQPVMLRTLDEPPRITPWKYEITKPAWLVRSGYAAIDHAMIDPILRGPVNRKRREFGLPPVRRVMNEWWLSPDGVLAMYPDWFAPGTIDFHPSLMHCGFPLDDVDGSDFTAPPDQPIVFTSGTAHQHCRKFFQAAAGACERLGRSGLFLTAYSENLPNPLPSGISAMGYASLRRLLPECSAIVHHGGIGTTSQALAAGVPQLIRPLAFDQFDNAVRVERLGCGRWLRSESQLAGMLATVLESSQSSQREALSLAAKRLEGTNGAEVAADRIDEIRRQRCS